jgi:hypothetical protein
MSTLERVRLLAQALSPAESVTLSRETLAHLLVEVDELSSRGEQGPPPDLTVAKLAARCDLSRSRIRELIGLGEWGAVGDAGGPYLDGRRIRIPFKAVLARESRLRCASIGIQQPCERAAIDRHGGQRAGTAGTLRERQRHRAQTQESAVRAEKT